MVVVAIIGILAVLAIPYMNRARMRAQDADFLNDLRVLSNNVLEQYAVAHGDYPAEALPGVMPPEVADYMPRRIDWSAPTPIGGLWHWERAAQHGEFRDGCYAGLVVERPLRTSAQMADIDGQIDDGNLNTGRFRACPSGYIRILED
jgi:type II secretory pathway pseudopilin PulG